MKTQKIRVTNKTKRFLALLSSLCVATSALSAVAIANNKGFTASADTASAVSLENVNVTVGQEVEVTFKTGVAATIDVTGITGQYLLTLSNATYNPQPFWAPSVFVQVDGNEESTVYLSSMGDNYRGVVTLPAGAKTLSISTYDTFIEYEDEDDYDSGYEVDITVTATAALNNLSIGVGYDYSLNEVKLPFGPTNVLFDGESGKYLLVANLGIYEDTAVGITVVSSGVATPLTFNYNYFAFTAEIEVTNGTYITFVNATSTTYTAYLTLETAPQPRKVLPQMLTLNAFEAVETEYTLPANAEEGWYTVKLTSVEGSAKVEDADISAHIYTYDYWSGTDVTESNYPVYLKKGETYNVDFVLFGSKVWDETINTIDVYADFVAWTPVTLNVTKDIEDAEEIVDNSVVLPVSAEGDKQVAIKIGEHTAGTYSISLNSVPFIVAMTGSTVTATINGKDYVLDETYTATVELPAGAATVTFTTSYGESFGTLVTLIEGEFEKPDIKDTDIMLGEIVDVTLSGDYYFEAYHLYNLPVGTYVVTLTFEAGVTPNVEVQVNNGDGIIIEAGDVQGTFMVTVENPDVDIILLYLGEETVNFKLQVNAA